MQIMAIFYSIIYIQYGAYTHHIIIGHSCVEYKEEVFLEFPYFYPHFSAFTGSAINNFQKITKI